MSQMAGRCAANFGYGRYGDDDGKRSRFTMDWRRLIGPDGYWPIPYSLDEAFQAIAWAMEWSWSARDATYTPAGLVRGHGAHKIQPWADYAMDGWPTTDPVGHAQAAIRRMLLSSTYVSPEIIEWRERIGVREEGHTLTFTPVVVTKPAYRCTGGPLSVDETGKRLEGLLTCAGRGRLLDQHNEFHAKAVYPQSVRLSLGRRWVEDVPDNEQYKATLAREKKQGRWSFAWRFDLRYGYPPPSGSTWLRPLAVQRPDETFIDVMLRAEAELARITEPEPGRAVDPGALERHILGMMERVARTWGAPASAIRRGITFGKTEHGDYAMDVGGGMWRARWDADNNFVRGDNEQHALGAAMTWPPDWRHDVASREIRDAAGDVLPVKPGHDYIDLWRGPFNYPGPRHVWRRWFRRYNGSVEGKAVEIRMTPHGVEVMMLGEDRTMPAGSTVEDVAHEVNATLASSYSHWTVLDSMPAKV